MSALEALKNALLDETSEDVVLKRTHGLALLSQLEQLLRDESKEPETNASSGQWYKHYKGGLYQVLMEVTHEGDKQPMVIYRASNGTVWARFRHNFHEQIEIDGEQRWRFSPIAVAK